MFELFASAFTIMLGAVGRIFLIIFAAGILVRKNVIKQEHVKALSHVTVNILLPAMLFSKICGNFKPGASPEWWMIPLASATMIMLGVAFGYLFYLRTYREKQFLIPLASMQNAVYLVLPIGKFMYPEQFDQFTVYNFLFLVGFMPIVWSLGKVLVTGGSFKTIKAKELLTTPLISALFTIVFVLLQLNKFVPNLVMDSIELVGDATIPVSNIVLGATLGTISFKIMPKLSDVIKLNFIKYIMIPVATILFLYFTGMKESNPLLANLLVIESAAAPATALILQIRAYGGDQQTIGGLMIISYIMCLFAIPFWIAIWQII